MAEENITKSLWRLEGLTWRELGRLVFVQLQRDEVFGRAAQLSYYSKMAILVASLTAGSIGFLWLKLMGSPNRVMTTWTPWTLQRRKNR